jgi:DinB superfamily
MISKQLDEITAAVQAEFSGLDDTQLNRRPAPDKWSIAQCLDHLVVSNETYFPAFESLINGKYRRSFWQVFNPFTNIAGSKGLELLKTGKTKLRAPKIFEPSKSDEIKNSVACFVAHQQRLGQLFDKLESSGVLQKVISSPLTSMLTLKTCDAINIIIEHESRHYKQALGVKESCISNVS